jgi:hypothetical protein
MIVEIKQDGNCMFRSISDQLYGDLGHNHESVRQDVCDFIEGHQDEFKSFMVPDDDVATEEVDDTYLSK